MSRPIYTCPMHPEVESPRPGACPKCGMALEPRETTAGADGENAELRDMTRRFWWSAALSLPVVVLGMTTFAPPLFVPFGILLSPMIAVAAMTLSSLSVIGNALRLRTVSV